MDRPNCSKSQRVDQTIDEMNTQKQQQQRQPNPTSISDLPSEILMDIFTRLPIKSVGFCRCVSKPWRSLATSTTFTKMHLSRSSPGLILQGFQQGFRPPYRNNFHFLESENHFESTPPRDLAMELKSFNAQFTRFDIFVEIVGSCNGLVCFSEIENSDPVYISNPIIGEYMTLPEAERELDFMFSTGFGHDPLADEYKVIRMVSKTEDKSEGEIYTIGSGSWRSLGDVPHQARHLDYAGVFLNGNLHWMHWVLNEDNLDYICIFDVHEERFLPLLPLPDGIGEASNCNLSLRVLGGNLSIVSFLDNRIEIWMMMVYGVNESWSKKYLIEPPFWGEGHLASVDPIQISENGEIWLMCNYEYILSYDPIQRVHQHLLSISEIIGQISGHEHDIDYETSHVASLVSLKEIARDERVMRHEGSIEYGKWRSIFYPIPSHNLNQN